MLPKTFFKKVNILFSVNYDWILFLRIEGFYDISHQFSTM